MKKKKHCFLRATVGGALAFTMLFSIFAPTVFAAGEESGTEISEIAHTIDDGVINYVSIGDSMTNGYGLPGYDAEAGVYDYGYDSYANKFAEYLAKDGATVNHAQLALSAARPEDINFLLRLDYDDPSVSALLDKYPTDDNVFYRCSEHSSVADEDIVYCHECKWDHVDLPGYDTHVDDYPAWWTLVHGDNWAELIGYGDFWTWKELTEDYRFGTVATYIKYNYGTPEEKARAEELMASRPAKPRDDGSNGEETCYVAKHYQEQVAKADVISIALGNGNFGVWLMGRITDAIMEHDGVGRNGAYDIQRIYDMCSPEMADQLAEILAKIDPLIDSYITDMMGALSEDKQESVKNVCIYGVLSFVVNYRGVIERILELNPDAEIVLTGLMNTYAGDTQFAEEGQVTIGMILDAIFPLLNTYVAAVPSFCDTQESKSVYVNRRTGEQVERLSFLETLYERLMPIDAFRRYDYVEVQKAPVFYYAEEYTIECLIQTFGDESFYNWDGVSRDRFVTGIVGECDHDGAACTDASTCPDWDYGILWELLDGFNMGGVTIQRITKADIAEYCNLTSSEQVRYAVEDKDKAGSIAVYLAIEDAICKSGKLAPVTLGTLTGLKLDDPSLLGKALGNFSTEQEKIIADYYDDAIAGLNELGVLEPTETQINDMSMILSLPTALSNALWTDVDLCGMLAVVARNKLGNGLGAHPSVAGHTALADAMIESYESGWTAKDQTIKNGIETADKYGDVAAAIVVSWMSEKIASQLEELREKAEISVDEMEADEERVTLLEHAANIKNAIIEVAKDAFEKERNTYKELLSRIDFDELNQKMLDFLTDRIVELVEEAVE